MERKKTSKKQFTIYVDYIKSHKILLTGTWSPSNNPEDVCRKKTRESKALSELEAEIIKLTGQGAVTGLDLGELGLNPSCSSTKTTTKQPGTSYTLHSEEREQSDEETKPASSPENQPSASKGTVKNKRSSQLNLTSVKIMNAIKINFERIALSYAQPVNLFFVCIIELRRTRTGDVLCKTYESAVNILVAKMYDIRGCKCH
nr:uncharacterized protein LOC111513426 isoform X2 [Leptinotarsa decemlineata]